MLKSPLEGNIAVSLNQVGKPKPFLGDQSSLTIISKLERLREQLSHSRAGEPGKGEA